MTHPVRVERAALDQVTRNAVGMVGTFGPGPVQRLSWVMLVVSSLGQVRYLGYGQRKVVQGSGCYRVGLAVFLAVRKVAQYVLDFIH